MPRAFVVSDLFRRSTMAKGAYLIRDDERCVLGEGAEYAVLEAAVAAGACCVCRSGMFMSTQRCAAIPGGFIYQMASRYSPRNLPERSWVVGVRAVRHVIHLLEFAQPTRLLPAEDAVPGAAALQSEWHEFAASPVLERIGASVGAMLAVKNRQNGELGPLEPVQFPVEMETRSRNIDGFDKYWFWSMSDVEVQDKEGSWILSPNGQLTPC